VRVFLIEQKSCARLMTLWTEPSGCSLAKNLPIFSCLPMRSLVRGRLLDEASQVEVFGAGPGLITEHVALDDGQGAPADAASLCKGAKHMTPIQPYLFFGGRCAEALDFYQRALGAQLEMKMLFSESPDKPPPGMVPTGWEGKVMHSSLRIGDSVIMASDGTSENEKTSQVSLSLSCKDNAEVDKLYAALCEGGGRQDMPPGKTFWSPYFGMLTDRFGIGWMVGVEHRS
jgi:PhnB protein